MLLEPGDSVRYLSLGAGKVAAQIERDFLGTIRLFAVIDFPHHDLSVQLPIGDPAVNRRLCHVLDADAVRELLDFSGQAQKLARNWDQREERGTEVLKKGGPVEWAALLCSYAAARRDGLPVVASDSDIVRNAQEMLASELWAAVGDDAQLPFDDALAAVREAYQAALVMLEQAAA